MIIKGGAVSGGGLGEHLEKEEASEAETAEIEAVREKDTFAHAHSGGGNEGNQHVRIVESQGVLSQDIEGAVNELRAHGAGITKKPVLHFVISAQPGQPWGEAEQKATLQAVLKEYGLEDQPYIVVGHEKDAQHTGRDEHFHIVASRINARGKCIDVGNNYYRNEKLSRIVEFDLGHGLTLGAHNRAVIKYLREKEGRADVAEWLEAHGAHTALRPKADLSHAEAQQQIRTHVTKAEAGVAVLSAFRAAHNAQAFQAALADKGFQLAKGREAGAVMVVDPAGGSHELTRLLRSAFKAEGDKQSAAQVRAQIDARLSDLDRNNLPDLAAAVAATREGSQPDPEAPVPAQAAAEEPTQELPSAAAVLDRLTWDKATFTEADLDRALKPIKDQAARAAFRAEIMARPDLLTVALDDGDRRMTTVNMAKTEARILDAGEAMASRHRFAVDAQAVESGLTAYMEEFRQQTGHEVNAEQIAAVRHVTGGADIAAVTGLAGAGKSTMMAGAARIWDSAGFKVEGCALSAVAAAKLAESGIASDTIASRLYRWDRATLAAELRQSGQFTDDSRAAVLSALNGWKDAAQKRGEKTDTIESKVSQIEKAVRLDDLNRSTRKWLNGWCDRQAKNGMDSRTVLVIDEAGMVNHRLMARLLDHAERAGAKVVAIGDSEQIQPIEAGSAFRILTRAVGAAELKEVIRQREGWQRTATQHLAAASPERAAQAVRTYADHGCIHVGIRSMSNIETLCREAEAALGGALEDGEREQIIRVSAYVAARQEAGALWAEIKENPQGHELADDFKAAQMARNASVQALASDIDAARPWLARYGVDSEGFAADLAFAEGQRRAAAEALAPDRAEAMGLTDLKADVKLHLSGREGARDALFQDWKADLLRDGMSTSRLILAYTRDDVAALNGQARAIMREAGHLSGPDHVIQTEDGPLSAAVGDRIMTLANDKTLGVQNGMTGRVLGIEDRESGAVLTIRADDGREIRIDTSAYENMQHAYACTLHKAQGVTADRTWLLHHRLMDRHLAYVGMSRHRDSVRLYAAAADAVSVDQLARQLGRGRTKDAIADYIDPRRLVQRPGEELGRIRQSIGQLSTTIRDLGRRLDAGLRRTVITTQQKEKTLVRAIHAIRPGKSPTIRQLDAQSATSRPPARTDRLQQVPRLVLARDSGGSALLLSRHAADQLQQLVARAADRLRRVGSADRVATIIDRGVNDMGAKVSTTHKKAEDIREDAFQPTLADWRDRANRPDHETDKLAATLQDIAQDESGLSERGVTTAEIEAIRAAANRFERLQIDATERGAEKPHIVDGSNQWGDEYIARRFVVQYANAADDMDRKALADAALSAAGGPEKLRKLSGSTPLIEEIIEKARERDEEHRHELNMHNLGDQKRTRFDDLNTWSEIERRNSDVIKYVNVTNTGIEIEMKDGQRIFDYGDRISAGRLMPVTEKTAEFMAKAAADKGWKEVFITGDQVTKKLIAEAMTARGIKVMNPELQDFVKTLDRAYDMADERAALAEARQKPDLADPQKFAEALSKYEHAIVNGEPDQQLRHMRADLMARGEALQGHPAMGETAQTWAEEAARAEAAEAVQEAVYTA